MNAKQLNNLFLETNTTPRDFIRWAAELGQTVQDSTVSRHRAGTQGITTPWAIAYKLFFRETILQMNDKEYEAYQQMTSK